jgi:hypothetical protein
MRGMVIFFLLFFSGGFSLKLIKQQFSYIYATKKKKKKTLKTRQKIKEKQRASFFFTHIKALKSQRPIRV